MREWELSSVCVESDSCRAGRKNWERFQFNNSFSGKTLKKEKKSPLCYFLGKNALVTKTFSPNGNILIASIQARIIPAAL